MVCALFGPGWLTRIWLLWAMPVDPRPVFGGPIFTYLDLLELAWHCELRFWAVGFLAHGQRSKEDPWRCLPAHCFGAYALRTFVHLGMHGAHCPYYSCCLVSSQNRHWPVLMVRNWPVFQLFGPSLLCCYGTFGKCLPWFHARTSQRRTRDLGLAQSQPGCWTRGLLASSLFWLCFWCIFSCRLGIWLRISRGICFCQILIFQFLWVSPKWTYYYWSIIGCAWCSTTCILRRYSDSLEVSLFPLLVFGSGSISLLLSSVTPRSGSTDHEFPYWQPPQVSKNSVLE